MPFLVGKIKPYAGEVMSPFEAVTVAVSAAGQTAVAAAPTAVETAKAAVETAVEAAAAAL